MSGGKKICGNCAFGETTSESPTGLRCLSAPPDFRGVVSFPLVLANHWCSHWQPTSWRDLPDESPAPAPRKPRQKPAKAPPSAMALIPDHPSPKDVLSLWDANYARLTGKPYTNGQRGGEAKAAAALVKAIAGQDRDWMRIERAMTRFHSDSWARGQTFSVFAAQFAKFDGEVKPKSAEGFL